MFSYLRFRVWSAGWRQKSRGLWGHEETLLHQPEGCRRQRQDQASRSSPGGCCYRCPEGKDCSRGGPEDRRQDRTGKEKSQVSGSSFKHTGHVEWAGALGSFWPLGLSVLLWSMVFPDLLGWPFGWLVHKRVIDWGLEPHSCHFQPPF